VLGGTPNGSLFSLWICPGILPAEWLDFSATLRDARTVDLEWATQTEINNDFFTVERSGDGQQWVALTQVDGAGNSDTERDYGFTDTAPLVGENHYRIRETSLDGMSTFSAVETVTILASDAIRIHPNPAQDIVTTATKSELFFALLCVDLGIVERLSGVKLPNVTIKTLIGRRKRSGACSVSCTISSGRLASFSK
jgi:hypothetical protein